MADREQRPTRLPYRPHLMQGQHPQAPVYYPLHMPHQSHPFSMNYPYPPPPAFHYLNQGTAPQPYSYHLPTKLPLKRHETSGTQDIDPKNIIDLDQLDEVKVEHVESGQEYCRRSFGVKYVKLEKEKSLKKAQLTIDNLMSKIEPLKVDEASSRRFQYQLVFKRLIKSFVNELPNVQNTAQECQEALCKKEDSHQKRQIYQAIYALLREKFSHFKKTKQELVKYIIRRTYHNAKPQKDSPELAQFQRLDQFHERNLKLHKSMNCLFLKNQFSNKTFLAYFQDFFENMESQFDSENNEKIEKFSQTITAAWMTSNLSKIQFEKKLPWLNSYKRKIKTLARELFKAHSNASEAEPTITTVE